MKFNDYLSACRQFSKDTAEWGALDSYKFYTTTGDGWEESCDNASGGIDVSWAFHVDVDSDTAYKHYTGELEKIMTIAENEDWDEEQCAFVKDLFADLMGE